MTEGRFNWRGLFACGHEDVHVVTAPDERVFGTDFYAIWNLSAVCSAEGIDIPVNGRYRAMAKEFRKTNTETTVNGAKLATLFDSYTDGIGPDPVNRLVVSQWSNGTYRPIIHSRTADVRMINAHWDAIPRLGGGSYWVACANWDTINVAVHWNMSKQVPFGAVQLIGGPLAGAKDGSEVWNMWNHDLARGVISEEENVVPQVVVDRRYHR